MATILHMSDVHFGPPHRADAAAALLALAEDLEPSLVAVSGDLTQRAKPAQFLAAGQWLASFRAPTIVVPGNHDVPMYRFWERLATPYRAWAHCGRERESVVVAPGVWAAGIDTSRSWTIKHGRLRSGRVAEVAALAAAAPAGAVRVAVAHHPLVPPPRFGEQRVAGGARAAVSRLIDAGFELVLGGHEHRFWVARSEDYWPGLAGLVHVHSGTSSSSRGRTPERGVSSCARIEVEANTIEVVRMLFDATTGAFIDDVVMRFPRSRRAS